MACSTLIWRTMCTISTILRLTLLEISTGDMPLPKAYTIGKSTYRDIPGFFRFKVYSVVVL
jgi:hypothetical protein